MRQPRQPIHTYTVDEREAIDTHMAIAYADVPQGGEVCVARRIDGARCMIGTAHLRACTACRIAVGITGGVN